MFSNNNNLSSGGGAQQSQQANQPATSPPPPPDPAAAVATYQQYIASMPNHQNSYSPNAFLGFHPPQPGRAGVPPQGANNPQATGASAVTQGNPNANSSIIDPMLSTISDGGVGDSDDEGGPDGSGGNGGGGNVVGDPHQAGVKGPQGGGNGTSSGISMHHVHHEQEDMEGGDGDPNGEHGDSPAKKKRRRQALSCTECKRRKIKCDRQHPCAPCQRRGEGDKCRWIIQEPVSSEKFVTRQEWDELRAKVQHLENVVASLAPRAFPHLLGVAMHDPMSAAAAAAVAAGMPPNMIPFGFPPHPHGPPPPGYPPHPHDPQHYPPPGQPGQPNPSGTNQSPPTAGAPGAAGGPPPPPHLYNAHLHGYNAAAAAAAALAASATQAAASKPNDTGSADSSMDVEEQLNPARVNDGSSSTAPTQVEPEPPKVTKGTTATKPRKPRGNKSAASNTLQLPAAGADKSKDGADGAAA